MLYLGLVSALFFELLLTRFVLLADLDVKRTGDNHIARVQFLDICPKTLKKATETAPNPSNPGGGKGWARDPFPRKRKDRDDHGQGANSSKAAHNSMKKDAA